MPKKIAILLNNAISNDHRVIKMISTLSKSASIDLFYINPKESDEKIFSNNVRLFSNSSRNTLKAKILRHTFFCYEFNYFIANILSKNVNYDIVWANDLPTLYPAYVISKKINAQLVYDSHEIYIETLNQFFPQKTSFFKRMIFKLMLYTMRKHGSNIEKRILHKVDHFITVNDSILNYFKTKYDLKKGVSIMNTPFYEEIDIIPVNYRKIYNWDETDVISLYQGVLNHGRGLDFLVNSWADIDAKYKMIIIGDGVVKEQLKEKVELQNLSSRVKFIDKIELPILPKYTSGADIGLNFLEDFNLSKKMASPNKLFEYIHAGIPVICSKGLENDAVLNQFNIGASIDLKTNSLSVALENIQNHFMKNKDISSYLLDAKKHYHWGSQEAIISSIIN